VEGPKSLNDTGSARWVVTGLERLFEDRIDSVQGKRLGLIANPTTVDASLRHGIDRLVECPAAELTVVFGPEHGFRGHAQDQVELADDVDHRTGLPIRSLYGTTRAPSQEMLAGLDAVVFDIQDVGSRYYTFIWTMAYAMAACARDHVEMIVLDRPNPIGGELVEGNLIERSHRSFVGLYPIPNRHGMTVGELARLFNEEFGIGCGLTVVPMKGWSRSMYFDQTGLPWVMPSPNMPTLDTAIVYPGACLIEGTNVSEGRGTTRPFEIVGAPWIDPDRLAAELEELGLPGVRFRPLTFEPAFDKFAGVVCGGFQQHVMDRRSYRPLRTGLAILKTLRRFWSSEFAWREPPYEYETERLAIDILAGGGQVRDQIGSDLPLDDMEATWHGELEHFKRIREGYLLYK
jgi:uncharacterized protein YbbC (DUF1343 family)